MTETKNRFRSLSISVFGITFSLVLFFQGSLKPHLDLIFGKGAPAVAVILSMIGYGFIYKAAIHSINKWSFFKKIYWGENYFDGLWSYTSHCNGKDYFGIWRVEQDVFELRVVAFGLDDDFRRRSTVQSVSDLIGRNGVFEVVNVRWDLSEGQRQQFSRTVIVPDLTTGHFPFRYPQVIRGETMLYGSSQDGEIAHNLRMVRRDDCKTEDELIAKLRTERTVVAPTAVRGPGNKPDSTA